MISTICDVEDKAALEVITHFYHALLGLAEADVAQGDCLDSVEALQAAMLRQIFVDRHRKRFHAWAAYVSTGIAVDMHGPKP